VFSPFVLGNKLRLYCECNPQHIVPLRGLFLYKYMYLVSTFPTTPNWFRHLLLYKKARIEVGNRQFVIRYVKRASPSVFLILLLILQHGPSMYLKHFRRRFYKVALCVVQEA
jgi:hypothetical protein